MAAVRPETEFKPLRALISTDWGRELRGRGGKVSRQTNHRLNFVALKVQSLW